MNTIAKVKFTLTALEKNIIHLEIQEGCTIGVDDITEIHEGYEELAAGKRYGVVVTSQLITSITTEAQKFAAEELDLGHRVGTAIISNNLGIRILAKAYIRMKRPRNPTRLFRDREKAISWLREKLGEHSYHS